MKKRSIVLACLVSLLLSLTISSLALASSAKPARPSAATICNKITRSMQAKSNSKFVSAELGISQTPLRARADSVGSWEKFTFYPNPDNTCSFKSNANGKYVTAEKYTTLHPLHARANTIGPWEEYDIFPNSVGTWSLQSPSVYYLWVSADIYTAYNPLIADANGSGYDHTRFYINPA